MREKMEFPAYKHAFRWKMIDYERLGYLDIMNTYKDAFIQKKWSQLPF